MAKNRLLSTLAATAIAVGGVIAMSPAAHAATGTKGCTYTFTGSGVHIRATPVNGTIRGDGQKGQTFFSLPFTAKSAGGLTWVKGTDSNTGKSGWAAEEYLHLDGCHLYY